MSPPYAHWLVALVACLGVACTSPGQDIAPITPLPDVAGPGSVEPNLSAGPGGEVIMSWLEPADQGMALRYSITQGDLWADPVTVARGDDWFINWADFPSVVAIDDSLWAAHWLRMAENGIYEYDVAVSVSRDGGVTWRAPVTPHTDGTLSEHGFVSLFPADDAVGALWLDGRETLDEGGMTLRSAIIDEKGQLRKEWLVDELVCDCCQTDVAVGPDGPVAVYRDRSPAEIRDIYVMRMIDGQWETGRPVADDGWEIAGCPVNGPAIAADTRRIAVAWFTAADDVPRIELAFSDNGARSFGAAVEISSDRPLGRVGIALDDDGSAFVSWLRQGDGSEAQILVRPVLADGSVGPTTTIASTGASPLSGFPQIASRDTDVIIAWTARTDEGMRVRSRAYNKVALRSGINAASEP